MIVQKRPSRKRRPHDQELHDEARRLARRGHTDVEIAIKLSVPKGTVSHWIKGVERGERPPQKIEKPREGAYDTNGCWWPKLAWR